MNYNKLIVSTQSLGICPMFHVSSRLLSEDSILEAILMSQPIILGETHNLVGFRIQSNFLKA